jgi:hypothetical protein
MKVSDFVAQNKGCKFKYFRQGYLYYTVMAYTGEYFTFPIPINDLGEASVNDVEKSIMLMRYIRKAIEDKTMVKEI